MGQITNSLEFTKIELRLIAQIRLIDEYHVRRDLERMLNTVRSHVTMLSKQEVIARRHRNESGISSKLTEINTYLEQLQGHITIAILLTNPRKNYGN